MNMYDVMYEAICDQYENGEITLEEAEILNDVAYDKYIIEAELTKQQKKEKKKEYKEKEIRKELYGTYGGRPKFTNNRKKIEVLDESHRYLRKLANSRDDESDKKLALAYKSIKGITGSPEDSNIEYSTYRDYTGKDKPWDEDYKKDKERGYVYNVTTYPHSERDDNGKKIISKDKNLIHRTNYDGEIRPSQYSFGHSRSDDYKSTTRLHPKRRIYGFAETDKDIDKYPSYGGEKKKIDTKGKPIYKNSEAPEGGFIEFD